DNIENNTGDQDALLRQMNSSTEEVNRVLKDGLQAYATQNSLTASERRIVPALRPYRVTFNTRPPDGKISLIHNLDWEIARLLSKDPLWTQITTDTLFLLGAYQYIVTWDDGRTIGPQLI